MPDLITETDFDNVRALIDLALTEKDLPNETISLDVYLGATLRETNKLTELKTDAIKEAAYYLLAARICPSVPFLLEEKSSQQDSYKRLQNFKPSERAEELRSQGLQLIEDAKSSDGDSLDDLRPTGFSLAKGK